MKKRLICYLLFVVILLSSIFSNGCSKTGLLSPNDPVTLNMWHVYSDQDNSYIDKLIKQFNETVGLENGVYINVSLITNTLRIGDQLRESINGGADVPPLPDIFTANPSDAAIIGKEKLLDWNTCFSKAELSDIMENLVSNGMLDDSFCVFPLSRSTHVLIVSATEYDKFCEATNSSYYDLEQWQSFYDTAAKYYYWSGKPLCAFDYPLRAIELHALEHEAGNFYFDGWYNLENRVLKQCWMQFARSLVQGHIIISDSYSSFHVMTGETPSGLCSSAGIQYYSDKVTYSDGSTVDAKLRVIPMTRCNTGEAYMTQSGVGLCAVNSTPKKNAAASLFAHWLSDSQRNIGLVSTTGYMPVKYGDFEKIVDYSFENPTYESLYSALGTMSKKYIPVSEPTFPGYNELVRKLYAELRKMQKPLHERYKNGEDIETLAEETWQLFCSIKDGE